MAPLLRRQVRDRAGDRCEYCRLPQSAFTLSFHVEHVIPRQHGGTSLLDNLALSCPNCNMHKGPNLTGIDPDSGELTRLFNPRADRWDDHFTRNGGLIIPLTAIGRTTAWVLQFNSDELQRLRARSFS